MSEPERRYPILVFGFNVKRWERRKDDGGQEAFVIPGRLFQFWIDRESEKMGPSELQKISRVSFWIQWPFMIKFSWYWRFQTPGVPGSERGTFPRFGLWKMDYGMSRWFKWTFYPPWNSNDD